MSEKHRPHPPVRDLTTITLDDIKQRLDISECIFPLEGLEGPEDEDGWQEMTWKRRSGTSTKRAKSRRTTHFSGNRALVKGIYVIAMGLRCAYLVDTITINKDQVEVLGDNFGSMSVYKHIAFLFEETTEQVYIVNLPLIRARSERFRTPDRTMSSEDAGMLWLDVSGGKPCVTCEMPRSLKAQINKQINSGWMTPPSGPVGSPSKDTSRAHIRIKIDRKDLPALSAWLLEYPVGYTFSEDPAVLTDGTRPSQLRSGAEAASTQRTNLDGEPLVLVKVKISGDKALGDNYDLLAFSYPAKLLEAADDEEGLAGSAEIRRFLQHIPVRLTEHYQRRLQMGHDGVRPIISVTAERVRLERVVL